MLRYRITRITARRSSGRDDYRASHQRSAALKLAGRASHDIGALMARRC